MLVTFVISIGAIIQRNHVTIGLVILNHILVADAFVVGIVGSFIWFYTLRERNNFHLVWADATPATRIFLQDHVIMPALSLIALSDHFLVPMLWLLQWERHRGDWWHVLFFTGLREQPQCHSHHQLLRGPRYCIC